MSGDVGDGFDYTLVQVEPCPLCGHDTSVVPSGDLAAATVEAARRWHEFLNTVCDHPGGPAEVRRAPAPEHWSAIEYACHVRDVLALFARRVELTVLAETPEYGWWDHEAAAIDEHYIDQDPRAVADDIVHAAAELSQIVQTLRTDQETREGSRLGSTFTVVGLVRFAIHEALHHLDDARAAVAVAA